MLTARGVFVLILAACAAESSRSVVPVEAPASVEGAASWEQLASGLPGQWVTTVDGHTIEVSYRRTARDSVLLETWMEGTPAETVSMVHLDGRRLVFTHYCGQGNQPRLALTAATGTRHQFERFDATDLQPGEAALEKLTLGLDGDTLERVETYANESETQATTMLFQRR